jgi:hypothetical protein
MSNPLTNCESHPMSRTKRRRTAFFVAISVLALAGCSSDPTAPSPAAPSGTVTIGAVTWSCSISASPLPGWRSCTGTVALNITKTISSGYVSVFYNYPDSGSFFHGDLQVGSGTPGNVTVNLRNSYVSHCANPFTTEVDVYNGSEGAGSAPLLASKTVTISGC